MTQLSQPLARRVAQIQPAATTLAEQGKLRFHIAHRFTLAEAEQTGQLIESGKAAGKVVVNVAF